MFEPLLESAFSVKVILAVFIVVIGYYNVRWLNTQRKIRQLGGHAPKYPQWLPFGIDFIYSVIAAASRDENTIWWDDVLQNYGITNTVEANAGGQRFILTADPENIKAILATQFNDYGKGEGFNKSWHEFLGDSIFSTDHEKWKSFRLLIRPQFIKDRVSDLDNFETHTQILLDKLGGKGQTVDVKDLFFRYTLDAATDFLFGRSVNSLELGQTNFAEAFAEIQRIQNKIVRAGPLHWLIPRKKFRRHLTTLNNFVQPFIEETLALSASELEQRTKFDHGYTFLHALASFTRDRVVLRDQLVAMLLAGRDTTAATLSWLFYELSTNPSVVQELRREIGQVVGWSDAPTYEDLKSMKFLSNTLNEILRLYPTVPFNIRNALHDTTLPRGGGPDGQSPIGILKDTRIGYSTHVLHLTSSLYPPTSSSFPNPAIFAPSRWNDWSPKPWSFIPFNGGPRICVGQQFALTEMGFTVVRILQRFKRIENRMGPGSVGGLDSLGKMEDKGLKGEFEGVGGATVLEERRKGRKSLVREFCEKRDVEIRCELVITPATAVDVAFYES